SATGPARPPWSRPSGPSSSSAPRSGGNSSCGCRKRRRRPREARAAMTVSVAFYGAGELARPYLDALGRRPDVRLAGVSALDRRAAEQVAAGWGAQVYLSYEAMLREAAPDALWVCVPPHLQGDVLLRAAEQRLPFFVAPPGAMSYERALAYGKAAREAELVTAVGFPTHATDVVREAR